MCECAWTSYDILEAINKKRQKIGLNTGDYSWMMCQHRNKIKHIKPIRKIGLNYIWDNKKAQKIINKLYKIPYRNNKSLVEYFMAA